MNKTTLLPAVIEKKKHLKELCAKAPAPPLNQSLIQCNVSPLASPQHMYGIHKPQPSHVRTK